MSNPRARAFQELQNLFDRIVRDENTVDQILLLSIDLSTKVLRRWPKDPDILLSSHHLSIDKDGVANTVLINLAKGVSDFIWNCAKKEETMIYREISVISLRDYNLGFFAIPHQDRSSRFFYVIVLIGKKEHNDERFKEMLSRSRIDILNISSDIFQVHSMR